MKYKGQAEQDRFVLNVLKFKKGGFFVELGSEHYEDGNNSFVLEKEFGWSGIMVEENPQWFPFYGEFRKNSVHVMENATKINYEKLFEDCNVPLNVDYLQIDLEVRDGSTLVALRKMHNEIMDKYKFATITFEHDIYTTNYLDTRVESRKIFEERGYVCVFEDVKNDDNPYEDWYVYPPLVDMDYIHHLQEVNSKKYKPHESCGESIGWYELEYIK